LFKPVKKLSNNMKRAKAGQFDNAQSLIQKNPDIQEHITEFIRLRFPKFQILQRLENDVESGTDVKMMDGKYFAVYISTPDLVVTHYAEIEPTKEMLELANNFRLYWLDGTTNVVCGNDAAEAMNNAGYGYGSLRALDFWAYGSVQNYEWNKEKRTWEKIKNNS
jgi:hypothetical protein